MRKSMTLTLAALTLSTGSLAAHELTREQVYQKIDAERNYQDQLSKQQAWEHQGAPSVAEELLMMEEYLTLAREAWVRNQGDTEALDAMRKVCGMAVRCFENHGVPDRAGLAN